MDRQDVDVAIRYSDGQYPGFSVQRLPDGPLSPVCSPELQKGEYPLRTPQDLQHHTLLHACWDDESDVWPTWRMWLARAGVGNVDPKEGYHFQQRSEEHTSELQSLMRISYAVFCLKKKKEL